MNVVGVEIIIGIAPEPVESKQTIDRRISTKKIWLRQSPHKLWRGSCTTGWGMIAKDYKLAKNNLRRICSSPTNWLTGCTESIPQLHSRLVGLNFNFNPNVVAAAAAHELQAGGGGFFSRGDARRSTNSSCLGRCWFIIVYGNEWVLQDFWKLRFHKLTFVLVSN